MVFTLFSFPAWASMTSEDIEGVYASVSDSGNQVLSIHNNGLAFLQTHTFENSTLLENTEIFVWKFAASTLELQMGEKIISLKFSSEISLKEHFGLPGSHPGFIPTEKKNSEIKGILWKEPLTFLDNLDGNPK